MKQPAQQSMSRARKEQEQTMLQSGQFPNDIGLLPDTFILPRNPRERYNWTIRKRWLYTRFWEWIATYQLRFMTRKPRPRLHLSRIPALAQDLHTRTLTAFAAGDLTPIQSSLSQGIFSSLKSRLATREPNTITSWHLLATLRSPKLVSYKPILLPSSSSDKTAQRDNWNLQAVVRLHTRQILQNLKKTAKRGAGGKMVEEVAVLGKPEVKEVVEYVVLQKVWRKARAGEWGLWGFADEMTLARLKREDARKMKSAAQGALTG
nr:hypothetical protein B0A51_00341 [Rachicladosporium sp. CCFEE 5018]